VHDVRLYQMGDTLEQGKFGRPKILSHYCPKRLGVLGLRSGLQVLKFNMIASGESSPEKARCDEKISALNDRFEVIFNFDHSFTPPVG